MITGRYSVIHRAALAEKMQRFADDPTPGEMWPELALQRALLQDFLDRLTSDDDISNEDTQRLFDWLENIGRMVERIEKIKNQTALTPAEVLLLIATIADTLQRFLSDEDRVSVVSEIRERIGVQ